MNKIYSFSTILSLNAGSMLLAGYMGIENTIASESSFLVSRPDCIPPPSEMVSWWPGDGNADDIIGDNDGTLMNGATFDAGRVDQALRFDGIDDIVQVPDSPDLNPTPATGFTIDTWAMSNITTGNGAVIGKGDPFQEQYVLDIFMERWRAFIRTPSNTAITIGDARYDPSPGTPVVPGEFTHLAFTWDGTTLKFYVNGALHPQGPVPASSIQTSNVFLGIGGREEGGIGNLNFNGLIDEVEYFNRALSDSEVFAIYNAGSAGKCKAPPCNPIEPPQQKTQGYWRRQCKDNPHEDICAYVDSVHALSNYFDSFDCGAVCDLMEVDPPENDMCRKAERQFMALLLNLASGKLAVCNCLVDGREVGDVIAEIDSLLENFSDHATCERAKTLADDINTGVSLVNCEDLERDQDDRDDRGYLTPIPNPSAFGTVIRYEVPRIEDQETGELQEERVSLKIYDISGRLIKTLVDESQESGVYGVRWEGIDSIGKKVQSGIYFYRLEVGKSLRTGKIVFVK